MELAVRLGLDPAAVIEDWTERASIREFDGGLSREDAERAALDELRLRYETSALTAGEPRLGPRSAPSTAARATDTAADDGAPGKPRG